MQLYVQERKTEDTSGFAEETPPQSSNFIEAGNGDYAYWGQKLMFSLSNDFWNASVFKAGRRDEEMEIPRGEGARSGPARAVVEKRL